MAYLYIAIVRMRHRSVATTIAVYKNKAKLSVERNSPAPHSGMMTNLRSSQSKSAWLDRSCGKNNMWLEEICCRMRYVAGGDMFLEGICCRRRYVAKGYMLPEGISTDIFSQRRYLAKGGI